MKCLSGEGRGTLISTLKVNQKLASTLVPFQSLGLEDAKSLPQHAISIDSVTEASIWYVERLNGLYSKLPKLLEDLQLVYSIDASAKW